ncbi:hypothetical protein [Xanthomonas euvesicatoria]|uniref:hypothetical protein n=1 Tax=Xanthomonas euvesicatoria TaxID=456327 RepID=UPI00111272B0|nr:hypothetical protein [Xanthomonas euvesicatoria]MCC8789707.1 hypothetical protein [Xanthomonas euvesicatoria pv. euvesicatoria]MCC8814599.1 hypothetical protein [Xanthomonas euvesicatoria pv. euvesicatoria]MDW7713591.1 hypothetical protein [Xanthomonas euvesicatoria]
MGTNTNIPTSSPARALAEDGGKLRTRTLAFAKKKSNKRITVMMGTHSNASHLHAKEKTVAPMAGATKIIHKHGHTLRFNLKLSILYDLS